MAKLPSKTASLKLSTVTQRGNMKNAVDLLEAHVNKIVEYWPKLDEVQRRILLSDSPQLARIIALVERLR